MWDTFGSLLAGGRMLRWRRQFTPYPQRTFRNLCSGRARGEQCAKFVPDCERRDWRKIVLLLTGFDTAILWRLLFRTRGEPGVPLVVGARGRSVTMGDVELGRQSMERAVEMMRRVDVDVE